MLKNLKRLKLNEEPLSAKELKLLKEAGEQGRLTPESYMEFLEVEDFVRTTNNKVLTQELKGKLRSNWLIDNLEAVNVKARRLDDVVPEMQMEKILDDANVIINKMDGEVSKYADDLTKISKVVSKEDPAKLIQRIENTPMETNAQKFYDTIEEVRNSGDMYKANIHEYTPEDYSKMKVYLSSDGKSGYAIKGGDELVSVFSTARGRGKNLVEDAVKNGARKLDAYDIDGVLPKLYGDAGFEVKARYDFDPKFADMKNPVTKIKET